MISGVLFDLDNTLIDRDIAFRGWAEWYVSAHLAIADEPLRRAEVDWLVTLDQQFGPNSATFAAIHSKYPDRVESVEALAMDFVADLRHHILPLDVPTIALLHDLATAGIPWGIVTNGSPTQLKKIERVGLTGAKCVMVSGILGIRKPEPGIFLAAAEGLGVAPENILFVGDNVEADILGAANVGMKTAWMHRGRQWPANEAGIEPDLRIDHVAKIRTFVGPGVATPGYP
ncbi:hexitol phosphatase HxpA [soil metagenome]